jgi:hypothetical protein
MYANSFAAAVETSDLRSGLFQFRNAGVPCWNKCLVVHGANHSRSSGDRGHQYLIGIESRIIDIRAAADHTNSRLRKPERKHVSWTMLLRFPDRQIQLFAGSGIRYRTQPYSDRKPVELTTTVSIRANQTFEEQ